MSDEQTGTDSPPIAEMRQAVERANERANAAETQLRGYVFKDVLGQFGMDPESGPGRLAVSAYDGAPDASQMQTWLEEQGFAPSAQEETPAPEGLPQRVGQRQRLDQLERDGTAEPAAKRMSVEEHSVLLKTDPAAAIKAHNEGRVAYTHLQ